MLQWGEKWYQNHPIGCLPSLTHHDITAGSHLVDDSSLLYYIINDLTKKKGKTPSDCNHKATEGYSLKKREAVVARLW